MTCQSSLGELAWRWGQPRHNTTRANFCTIWIEIFSTSKILLPPSAPSGEKELQFQIYSNLFLRNFHFKLHIWLPQRTSCALVFGKTCKKQLKMYMALTFFPHGGQKGAAGFSNYRPVQCERCRNCLGLYFVQVEPNSPRLYCFIWEVQKSDLQFQPPFFFNYPW